MDALALLCNLYGDGPATLQRLRAHGVLRIEDLNGRAVGEIGACLEVPVANARRFLKEAAALEQRVQVGEAAKTAARPTGSRATNSPPPEKPRGDATPERVPAHVVVRGKRAVLAAAARRWNELDRAEAPRAGAPAVERPAAPASELLPEPVRTTPLATVEVDRATSAALAAAGVQSLERLVATDGEALALEAGLGLSQVLFVQGLARRKLRELDAPLSPARPQVLPERPHAAPAPESSPPLRDCVIEPGGAASVRFSPSERPQGEWLGSRAYGDADPAAGNAGESAGPFA